MATRARQEGDKNIIYHETLDYAIKMGESENYRMSRRWDYDCVSALTDACEMLRAGMDEKNVLQSVVDEFGPDRMGYILAATVKKNEYLTFTDDEKEWADTVQISDDRYVNASNIVLAPKEAVSALIAYTRDAKAKETPQENSESGKPGIKIMLPKAAMMGEPYDKATMFRMPKGDRQGSIYYLPNSALTDKGETIEAVLNADFVATIRNRGEETKVPVSELKGLVEGKEYPARRGETVTISLPSNQRRASQEYSRLTFQDGSKSKYFFCNNDRIKENGDNVDITVYASRNFNVYSSRDSFMKMTAGDLKNLIQKTQNQTKGK